MLVEGLSDCPHITGASQGRPEEIYPCKVLRLKKLNIAGNLTACIQEIGFQLAHKAVICLDKVAMMDDDAFILVRREDAEVGIGDIDMNVVTQNRPLSQIEISSPLDDIIQKI